MLYLVKKVNSHLTENKTRNLINFLENCYVTADI